jgi:hypothetical protein
MASRLCASKVHHVRKLGRLHIRHALYPPLLTKADIHLRDSHVCLGPIVLQKSFRTDDQKFYRPQARLSCKDVGDLIALTLNSQATSTTRLRLHESAIGSRFVFSRKIRDPTTFDFCNTIGPSATSLDVRCLIAIGGKADETRTGQKRRS